ncbi:MULTISPECIES: hypothetical protein [Cysteiniphilum]|uniref:hypothetical protein n=1 Tax=Cysteiniphilum TaxID=2056696 RepID=UPI00177DD84C|nr:MULTISPECIES: hypothetical protein [Cysteiniphilum]
MMLKQKFLTQYLSMAFLGAFGINVYAEDFYFTKPDVEKIHLKHQGYFGVSNINISDATHFEIHANQCDEFFNENQCVIDVLVKDLAASHTATLNYQVTDLISGNIDNISKILEAAPAMYQLKNTSVEYDDSSKYYQLEEGENIFTLEVIGGFSWINPQVVIDTDVASIGGTCSGAINSGNSCDLIITPNSSANSSIGEIIPVKADSYADSKPLRVQMLYPLDLPQVHKIAPALTRITLKASHGSVQGVDISEFMNSDLIEFSHELSSCVPDDEHKFNLKGGESCHFFIHQKPAEFQRLVGEESAFLTIKTAAIDYQTKLDYSGFMMMGDNDGADSSGDNEATIMFYSAKDGEIEYVNEVDLSLLIGKTINEVNQMTANLYGEFYFSNNRGGSKQLYQIDFDRDTYYELENTAGSDFVGVATAKDLHMINGHPSLSTFFLSSDGRVVQTYRYLNAAQTDLIGIESVSLLEMDGFFTAGFSAYHNRFYAAEDGERSEPVQFAVVDVSGSNQIESGVKTVQDGKGNGATNFVLMYDPYLGYETAMVSVSEDTKYSPNKVFVNNDPNLPQALWQEVSSIAAFNLGDGIIPMTQLSRNEVVMAGKDSGRLYTYNVEDNTSLSGSHSSLDNAQTLASARIKGMPEQGIIAFDESLGFVVFAYEDTALNVRSAYYKFKPIKANKNQMVISSSFTLSAFNDTSRYAFITDSSGNGDLSSWVDAAGATGVLAANNICQANADRKGLSGTYKAWLSDENVNALDNVGYNDMLTYFNLNDELFALPGNLVNEPLNVQIENALPQKVPHMDMWTGTYALGTLRTPNCNNWTSSNSANQGNYGDIGLYNWNPWKWTEFAGQSCNQAAKLYCFEV